MCFVLENRKAYGTRSSQAVPHPSTILARQCLTSVIGRERVYSSWYGRRHLLHDLIEYFNLPYVEATTTNPCSRLACCAIDVGITIVQNLRCVERSEGNF